MRLSFQKIWLCFLDVILINSALFLAFVIRFDGDPELPRVIAIYQRLILPITVIRLAFFYFFGFYHWSFRYASLSEALRLLAAVTSGSFTIIVVVAFFFFHQFRTDIGRSVLLVEYFLCLFLIASLRFSVRIAAQIRQKLQEKPKGSIVKRVLILGANDWSELLVREFLNRPILGYLPIVFLDNDPQKQGIRIHGVKVAGKLSELSQFIQSKKIDKVIIALAQAASDEVKEILHVCRSFHVSCRIVPQASFLLSSHVLPLKLREVDVADLLDREIVQADFVGIREFFVDKKVLITGAGGSIGSELARSLFQNQPAELILIDNSENNLYEIEAELQERQPETQISSYLCDVTNQREIEKIFDLHRPHIVYHAAAHKHVPLIEKYFRQGILNNVLGTKILADLSLYYNVGQFIFISSDKALRPNSVMGVTKRIAELYLQSLKNRMTRFVSVRFGNVLNSRGSVVPVFKRQLMQGQPVTVTHPEVKRYFMDVSEAVFLILQATLLGSESEIFLLDMGKPIKIVDLARDLAQLMGIPPETVPIKYIGLRPGEKLEEELEMGSEAAIPTAHKKIRIWRTLEGPPSHMAEEIQELLRLVEEGASREEVIQKLKQIVPEYQPWFPKEVVCVEP